MATTPFELKAKLAPLLAADPSLRFGPPDSGGIGVQVEMPIQEKTRFVSAPRTRAVAILRVTQMAPRGPEPRLVTPNYYIALDTFVMTGRDPAIHEENPWLPGSRPGMTNYECASRYSNYR